MKRRAITERERARPEMKVFQGGQPGRYELFAFLVNSKKSGRPKRNGHSCVGKLCLDLPL
jgi:hypothetical protein